jgi:hypothetical protein
MAALFGWALLAQRQLDRQAGPDGKQRSWQPA